MAPSQRMSQSGSGYSVLEVVAVTVVFEVVTVVEVAVVNAVVVRVVEVVGDAVVEAVEVQQSSWLWHFSSAMQPPSDGQNRVPGGLQGSTMLFPGTQVQYLGVQQPSEI